MVVAAADVHHAEAVVEDVQDAESKLPHGRGAKQDDRKNFCLQKFLSLWKVGNKANNVC